MVEKNLAHFSLTKIKESRIVESIGIFESVATSRRINVSEALSCLILTCIEFISNPGCKKRTVPTIEFWAISSSQKETTATHTVL